MSSPTLDEILRAARRSAIAALSAEHDAAFHKDVERTLAPENLEKLKVQLMENATYAVTATRIHEDKFSFSVGVRLIEVKAFVDAHTQGVIKGEWYSKDVPLRTHLCNLMTTQVSGGSPTSNLDVTYPHFLYYKAHPLTLDVIDRIEDFCGPSTVQEDIRMRLIDKVPTLCLTFSIPVVVPTHPV